MRQTLFFIPHFLFEGWLVAAWLIVGALILGYQLWVVKSNKEAVGFVPMYLIVAAILYFVVPQLEVKGINPDDPTGELIPLGLAIRGYGFFMLLAMVAGVGVTLLRCRQVGFNYEKMFPLAFWMIVLGLIGARMFYVIQKWDSFPPEATLSTRLIEFVDMTKGGLVVYGSLIGGTVALFFYLRANRLSWQLADIIAPGMVLGLAIGRIGCLMNGCCYGGPCEAEFPGLAFPPGSPPYMHQLADGRLLGLDGQWTESGFQVNEVADDSLAAERGIKQGDQIVIRSPDSLSLRAVKESPKLELAAAVEISSERLGRLNIPGIDLPDWSLPTHPTQLYSATNAFLLFLVLWFLFPFRLRNGDVYAAMLILYAVGRFLLEMIRTDEAGQFGTSITISQWISMLALLFGIGLLAYVRLQTEPPIPELSSSA